MKLLMENWRAKLAERNMPNEFYKKKTFEEFKQDLSNLGNIWIFFDTETTGLDPRKKEVQVTQVAAVAYDFSPWFAGQARVSRHQYQTAR